MLRVTVEEAKALVALGDNADWNKVRGYLVRVAEDAGKRLIWTQEAALAQGRAQMITVILEQIADARAVVEDAYKPKL